MALLFRNRSFLDDPAAGLPPDHDQCSTSLLVALRARIAEAVADLHRPQRDLASLSRRLLEIAREIEVFDISGSEDDPEKGPIPDEPFDYTTI